MKLYLYLLLCATLTFGSIMDFENEVCASEIAIVTLAGSGEVAFIDIENANLIKTVQLNAPFPFGVAVTPDGKTAVVACNFGQICFIDVEKMELIKCLKLLRGPDQNGTTLIPNEFAGVDITPDGKTALVTEANELGQLFFIDIETKQLSGTNYQIAVGDDPEPVIVNDNGTEAYLLDIDDASTYNVNLSNRTKSLICGAPAGNDEVDDFVLTPDESHAIYIGSDNWIYLRDIKTCAIKEALEIIDGRFREPTQVALSPDGKVAIMTNITDQSVTFFSVNIDVPPYMTVEETIDVGGGAHGVAFTDDGQTAVVAVASTSLVQIIDVANRQIKATVQDELGLAPIGVAIVEANTDTDVPPEKAALISPSGTITDNTPTYTWSAVENSTWYRLQVGDKTVFQWVSGDDANCGDGTGECSLTPATGLADGKYNWWIQTWNEFGTGPWSDALSFTVDTDTDVPPEEATLISPSGTITEDNPTYTWSAVETATWYYLWVNDITGTIIKKWYTADQANCGDGVGVCSVTPATELSDGACKWWIQTWNDYGYGPWSDAMAFTVDTGTGE